MNRKQTILTLVGVLVVALLAWQSSHSAQWQHFSWAAVWTATRQAEWINIAGAVVLIYVSYLMRVFRWQQLMSPRGRFWPVLKGTAIGFTGTALLGRPAELVRPYYIARKHYTGIGPQLAVWVLERTFDTAGVVLLVALDLAFDPHLSQLTSDSAYQHAIHRAGETLSIGIVVMLGLLYLFHLRSKHFLAFLHRRQQAHPLAVRRKFIGFLETLAKGTVGLTQAGTMLVTLATTLGVWLAVSGSVWLTVRAYPGMLPGFSITEGILLMGFTAVGAVLQLPAVGGGFQVLTLFALTKLFGADSAPATSAALIAWMICFYAISPIGLALTAHEGVSWRRMEHEAMQSELANGS